MKFKRFLLIFLFTLFFISTLHALETSNKVNVYIFGASTCPYCNAEKTFFEGYALENKDVVIHYYELDKQKESVKLLTQLGDTFNKNTSAVPMTFVSGNAWIGFSETLKEEILNEINFCLEEPCKDTLDFLEPEQPALPDDSLPDDKKSINIFGKKISLKDQSLIVNTLIIGFVDGMNPCSLWMLIFLLSIVVYTNSKKKIFIIGIVFLTVTALIYGLFITSVLSAMVFFYSTFIKVIIVSVAVIFGLINIKDYFWFKKGISLTIADKRKPKIFERMKNLVNPKNNIFTIIIGTIVLAAGVTILELPCTAGLPLLWANIIASSEIAFSKYFFLLGLYLLVYLLDEIIIFLIVALTLKSLKMEEKHGRILKLFSGLLIFSIGVTYAFAQNFMQQGVSGILLLTLGSLLLTYIINMLYKKKITSA